VHISVSVSYDGNGYFERINHNTSYCLSQFWRLVASCRMKAKLARSSGRDNEVDRFGCVEMELFPTKR
jgi:hypothetical protein